MAGDEMLSVGLISSLVTSGELQDCELSLSQPALHLKEHGPPHLGCYFAYD